MQIRRSNGVENDDNQVLRACGRLAARGFPLDRPHGDPDRAGAEAQQEQNGRAIRSLLR